MNEQHEMRRFPSLRKHVDEMLSEGAVITARDPTTLVFEGQALEASCGMLIGAADVGDSSEPMSASRASLSGSRTVS